MFLRRFFKDPSRSFSIRLVAMVFVLSGSALSSTLAEYKKSVDSTRAYVAELKVYQGDESAEPEEVTDIVSEIRENLPASQRVHWVGGTTDTSNQWLAAKLDAFENETDSTKRASILTEIEERLTAISQKLNELENPTAARTKDEDKQKLAEILRREEYQKPQQGQEGVLQRWLREFFEWLESIFPRPKVPDTDPVGMPSLAFILQILLYLAIAALIGFGLYKFAPVFFPDLKRKPRKKKADRVILGERVAADASGEDLFAAAERLADEGDLRGAIRKAYVALLCELSDRKLIRLARHKTNRDYLRDLRRRDELYPNVSGLTNAFEQHWYGLRSSASADWKTFRDTYRKSVKIARNSSKSN